MIHALAEQMGKYISKNTAATSTETAKISYGLEIILGAAMKCSLLLLTSYFLGIFYVMLIVLLTASAFRILTGGAHFSTYYRCLFAGLIIFNGLGYLTEVIANTINKDFVIPVISFIAVTGLVITYKYAPADAVIKPRKDSNKKLLIKELSFALVIIWYSTMMLLINPMTANIFWYEILIGSTLGFAWQFFTVTPLGFKSFGDIDEILNKIISKEEVSS